MSFLEPISRREMEPRHLPRATRDFLHRARALGLLGHGPSESGPGMEGRADTLLDALKTGSRLDPKIRMQIGAVVAWLDAQGRSVDVQVVRKGVLDGRLKPLSRDWWVLTCLFFQDDALRTTLARSWASWSKRAQQSFKQRVGGLEPKHLTALPDILATRVVRTGVRLDEVATTIQVPAGCPLEAEVWARLLSVQAAPWMLSQPFALVDLQLSRRQGHWSVGAIGRQLLEPAAERGAGPEDVAPGAPFSRVVEAVARRMPSDRRHAAWVRLGDKATELMRWWQTQRDLEKFFREWNADPEREEFWRAYVRHIRGVEAYRTASALAMRIGRIWFVEFGAIGFACYAFRDEDWQRSSWARDRATTPKELRDLPSDRTRRKTHRVGWEPRFTHWINELTGTWP